MPANAESQRVDVAAKHHGSGLAQWALLLGPIFAAYGQEQLAFAFVTWACTRSLPILVHLPTLLAAAIIVFCAFSSWRTLGMVGRHDSGDERSSDARARFMASASLTLSAFSLLLVVAQWLPTLFVHPCTG